MKNITLRKIRYFTALVKYKNFGLAANAVAISQPAMSMQIKDLENEVGATLIERGANQVILTNLGLEFHQKCINILKNVDDLTAIARTARGQRLNHLRIGIIPTVAPYLLPKLILETKDPYPDLSLVFKESQTANLMFELREGNLDCCILALPVSEPSFETRHLFDENFLLVRKAGLSGDTVPAPSDLFHHKLLLLVERHRFRDQAISFCGLSTDFNAQQHDASSFTTLVQMVAAGLGLTLIPEMAKESETSTSDVIVERFPDPQPKRSIGMIWRNTSPIQAELQNIFEVWKKFLNKDQINVFLRCLLLFNLS